MIDPRIKEMLADIDRAHLAKKKETVSEWVEHLMSENSALKDAVLIANTVMEYHAKPDVHAAYVAALQMAFDHNKSAEDML
jgi:hypothetical protein